MDQVPVLVVSIVKLMDPADPVQVRLTAVPWMAVKLKDKLLVPMEFVLLLSFVTVTTAKL